MLFNNSKILDCSLERRFELKFKSLANKYSTTIRKVDHEYKLIVVDLHNYYSLNNIKKLQHRLSQIFGPILIEKLSSFSKLLKKSSVLRSPHVNKKAQEQIKISNKKINFCFRFKNILSLNYIYWIDLNFLTCLKFLTMDILIRKELRQF